MTNPVGRPMKYRHYLTILEDDVVYTPATIVDNGVAHGFRLPPVSKMAERELARLRIRHTLARFTKNHGFPFEGDGWVIMRGQAPLRGWFGWRWKNALPLEMHTQLD